MMATRRKRTEPADPAFAAEMQELAERHGAKERERLRRPPTATGAPIPPLLPSKMHHHDEGCWVDQSGVPVRHDTLFVGGAWLIGRRCQRTWTWIAERPATPEECRRAADAQRAARA